MRIILCFFVIFLLLSCHPTTFFIVRHAEKVNSPSMSVDVPLTESGKQRAEALKAMLRNEHITAIYSTNYNRTKATVLPLAEDRNLRIQLYDPRDTSFVTRLKHITKGNILVVGHSNTVDDIVNRLSGARTVPGDLDDNQYGDLFIIRIKGNKATVEKKHFGQ